MFVAPTSISHLVACWVNSDTSLPLSLSSRLYSTAPVSRADTAAFGTGKQGGGLAMVSSSQCRVVDPPLAGRQNGKLCPLRIVGASEPLV